MKHKIQIFICLCLALAAILSACGANLKDWSEGTAGDYSFNRSESESAPVPTTSPVTHHETTEAEESSEEKTATTAEAERQQPVVTIPVTDGKYYFSQLSDTEQEVYLQIYSGCEHLTTHISLTPCTKDEMDRALTAFEYDWPEFYWTTSEPSSYQTVNDAVVSIEFTVPENAEEIMQQTKAKAEEIINAGKAAISPDDTYLMLKYFFDTIVDCTDYIPSETDHSDQLMSSVLLEGRGVCAAYAKTFLYLCQLSDIECALVTGSSKGDSHAWNAVKINDQWYWVDVTWGDPLSNVGSPEPITNYNYLAAADDFIYLEHSLEMTPEDQAAGRYDMNAHFTIPTCTDDSLEFLKLEGAYFETYDEDVLKNYIADAAKDDNLYRLPVRFANAADYERFKAEFLSDTDAKIWDALIEGNPAFTAGYGCSTFAYDEAFILYMTITMR